MNGLWISNLIMACKNITQLDLLKGNFRFQDKHGTHPNPFDLGPFSNINSVFNGDYWAFWWPSEITHYNDGTQFPMKPALTISNLKDLPLNIQKQLKYGFDIPDTIDELLEKHRSEYEGAVLVYMGKEYTLSGGLQEKEKSE